MSLAPMHFRVMYLIGMFKPLLQGHQYVLTVIDMLMNYGSCIPVFTKEADEVVHGGAPTWLMCSPNLAGRKKLCQIMKQSSRTNCLHKLPLY